MELDYGFDFQDSFPSMIARLGAEGFIGELCNGFRLLMDVNKGLITFESLKMSTLLLGLEVRDDELVCMLMEGDLDGDGALNQMEFCILMFRLSPCLMDMQGLRSMGWIIKLISFAFLIFNFLMCFSSVDILAVNQSIIDGESLVSADGTFEVGFFSPGNSTGRYLGVWYRNLSPLTVVWVANREAPLQNGSGVLKFNEKGVLVILNCSNSSVWSSNISNQTVNNPIAKILDSGNLVVKNGQDTEEEHFLWQSFDYPCDTMMPGMKLGWNLVTGLDRFLSSWESEHDPAKGKYSVRVDLRGYPQLVFMRGSTIKFRLGSWNGISSTGYPTQQLKQKQRYKFVMNAKEVYHVYENLDSSMVSIYTLNPSGIMQGLAWTSKTSGQIVIAAGGRDTCDNYALCGANSVCNIDGNTPRCECLKGCVPSIPEQWNVSYWSGGCVPRKKSICENHTTDRFWRYTNMKLPDTSSSWFNKSMNLEECQKLCLKSCSCTAYANLDIRRGGSGCLLWFGDLVDMRKFSHRGQDLYIRVPAELDSVEVHGHGNQKKIIGITIGVFIIGFIACVCRITLRKRAEARVSSHLPSFQWGQEYFRLREEDMELPTFDFPVIAKATNNFSSRNKLGEGGFGPVYKGTLIDGLEVAVKRHSTMSDQGLDEFKNEVLSIAKLQHRNLVKLLGCCIQEEEKMLIYEYMPNKSLDRFIFDGTRSKLLSWCQRFHIICGIARGLLYLHQDSRLRIVHRDLKTSNILLDAHMNPKISDFGMARTLGGDQNEDKTKKVVGTYGYMPPEYAVHGHYSVKSDVFSFGVIVLEIISGKKNRGFSVPEHSLNLLGHAWRLWIEDGPAELIDEHLHERCIFSEVLRCIHVALLCVQQKQRDRPDMSTVILMLNGEKLLPQPKAPGFYTGRGLPGSISSSSRTCNLLSSNELSLTIFEDNLVRSSSNFVHIRGSSSFEHVILNSTSLDTLAPNQSIRDGETLVSNEGTFEVGFFSPGTSKNRYLGIWYMNVSPFTVVWVANREKPLQNNSGVLIVNGKGVLVILDDSNSTIWSSNTPKKVIKDPIAQLLDSGNLVVKNGQGRNEHNFLTLSSWKNEDDPAEGEYSIRIDLRGYPQFFGFKGSMITYRAGSWNGHAFTGYPIHQLAEKYSYEFVFNEKEVYYEYKPIDRSVFYMYTLTPLGFGQRFVWTSQTCSRRVIPTGGADPCENYALCGANSICTMDGNVPKCECLKGYVPNFPQQWNMSYWSSGCAPRNKSMFTNSTSDGFWRYSNMKLPDTSLSWFSKTLNLEECQKSCLKNSSCTSYANLDIRSGGSGCPLWFGDMIDMRTFSKGGQDLYIRVPFSELDLVAVNDNINEKKIVAGITIGVIIFTLTTWGFAMILKKRGTARVRCTEHYQNILRKEDIDLPTFDLPIIVKATENFSYKNKLGEGGFGPVYKGTLIDGQELAVKRLSKNSAQGLEEFKNEVVLITKLQHRNLVKLLGCCIQGEEIMLIYEYMPNKSLDYFIFDETQRTLLNWQRRFKIICGIARGLLYLHQDSRLRIIHRDLKSSNILLDANLDPKISDFGLARKLLGEQIGANTNKVSGTYGYMPPEYATRGHFSIKSDVFSFGVIVLEIISGKKNREFSHPEHCHNLLGHAWKLWSEGRQLELLDEVLGEKYTPSEVIQCIQVGLLCVQQKPEDRPDMSSVVLMLNGDKLLLKPKVPGFYIEKDTITEANTQLAKCTLVLPDEVSITLLEAR
ncbi:uncharacterized protein LOC113865090 [Abrus precatorius]|uniref:non-specific serine/threonine protein kinase n=1 Tax=Abrus precatorius TaxID=3816 RepID=A0A8B8LGM7_ABRPR|nr:uncharacterized protein LOC113865090 [Abrus precatorius]